MERERAQAEGIYAIPNCKATRVSSTLCHVRTSLELLERSQLPPGTLGSGANTRTSLPWTNLYTPAGCLEVPHTVGGLGAK